MWALLAIRVCGCGFWFDRLVCGDIPGNSFGCSKGFFNATFFKKLDGYQHYEIDELKT